MSIIYSNIDNLFTGNIILIIPIVQTLKNMKYQ